jgi:hypothetical protein
MGWRIKWLKKMDIEHAFKLVELDATFGEFVVSSKPY